MLQSSSLRSTSGAGACSRKTLLSPSRLEHVHRTARFSVIAHAESPPLVIGKLANTDALAAPNYVKLHLIGTVAFQAPLKEWKEGRYVTNLLLSVPSVHNPKGADSYRLTAWDGVAQASSEQLSKGAVVAVQGRMRLQTWYDKAGLDNRTLSVTADSILRVPVEGQQPR